MTRFHLCILIIGLGYPTAGCSDDATQPQQELGTRDLRTDGSPDAAPDAAPDGKTGDIRPSTDGKVDGERDLAQLDGRAEAGSDASDGGGDAAKDAAGDGAPSVDQAVDAPISGAIFGVVSRSVLPVFDAKGPIHIQLYGFGLPPPLSPPLDKVTIPAADLSLPGATVPYRFAVAPAPGVYAVYAFLDDNENAVAGFPFFVEAADSGDIVTAGPIEVDATKNAPVRLDIVLDTVLGAPTDGGHLTDGPAIGALRGRVRLGVTPALDGRGPLLVTLHTTPPPSLAVAQTVVDPADLSSPYANVEFYLGGLAPGKYYLDALLDDNANYNVIFPGPDKDDLVLQNPVLVRIEDSSTTNTEVVLDLVKP